MTRTSPLLLTQLTWIARQARGKVLARQPSADTAPLFATCIRRLRSAGSGPRGGGPLEAGHSREDQNAVSKERFSEVLCYRRRSRRYRITLRNRYRSADDRHAN